MANRGRNLLEQAWRYRYHRELNECAARLLQLEKIDGANKELAVLRASLLRAEGRLDESDQLLSSLEQECLHFNGRLPLQKALNYFARGDYASAWPLFRRAQKLLLEESERLMALTNLVGCRDNLGLPFENELAELETLLAGKTLQFPDLFSQARLLRQRLSFRRGEWNKLFTSDEIALPSQENYFRVWVAALPYLEAKFSATIPGALPSHFFHFRLHTLIGKAEATAPAVKSSELIDRIYLWTWKWLIGDPLYPLPKILSQISWLKQNSTLTTAEDYLLARNALGWLDLFGRSNISEPFLSRFSQFVSDEFPVLEIEWDWIQYFRAEQNGHSRRRPKKTLPGTRFEELASDSGSFPIFRRRLLRATDSVSPNTIYPERFLAVAADGKTLCARDPVLLATLTLRSPSLSFSSICELLWGIQRYDAVIHAPKVQRAVQRLKKFFPVDCTSQNGMLFTEWRIRPEIYDSAALGALPGESAEWLKLGGFSQKKNPADTSFLRSSESIRREQVEKALGISRAGAARWIKAKVAAGQLKKIGRGKRVHYEWSLR